MAKLAPKDPQYGIPVSTRIDRDLAFRLNAEAEEEGMSLSRYLAQYIERVEYYEKDMMEQDTRREREKVTDAAKEKRLKELESQLLKIGEIYKKVVNRFIFEISDGNKTQKVKYLETYNAIMIDERQKYADGKLIKTP